MADIGTSATSDEQLPFGNIVQTLTTQSGSIIDLHDCGLVRGSICKVVTITKDNERIGWIKQPLHCMDVSICPATASRFLISHHISNDEIMPNSVGGFLMMLKQEENPDAINSRSMISCTLYEDMCAIDEVPIALPDLRVTKPLMYFDHHKYLLWREDIVVCCAVTYVRQGTQSGTKFFNSIPVPIGTTSVLFRDGQLHFTGSYGTHTIDYTPQWE